MERVAMLPSPQKNGQQQLNEGQKPDGVNIVKSNKPLKAKTNLKAKTTLKATKPIAKKPKKHTVSWYKKEADTWHSKATRYRFAEYKNGEWVAECVTCRTEKPIKQLQCGHFMSRQHNSLRYSEENTAPQCYGCNVMQQGKQYEFGLWVDSMYGDGTAKRLYKESKTPHQFTVPELEEIIRERKTEVEFYLKQFA